MVTIGSGAKRSLEDIELSRYKSIKQLEKEQKKLSKQ